ncbi:hypothetical protein [Arthrobacter sp. AFG20]|uniref:hypothetical protein n=1 Tax=Arthrobacter sp. AFG20 TaxID=1688671 RepID=UPI0011AF82A5|nr:hypothetical protein [Arthrobacter sp. AFG20]
MKRWAAEHPFRVAAMAVVLGWGAVVAVDMIRGRPLEDALFNASFWMAAVAVIGYFTWKRSRKTADRLSQRGQILLYLRYPDARPGSLSGIWNMGVATLEQGRIEFQPAVYDTLEPSGRSTALTGIEALSVPRLLSRQDAKYVSQRLFQVVTFASDVGRIEIAASPGSFQTIRETVLTNPSE